MSSGMKAAGYTYVNLDGGWNLLQRDAAGQLQPDPAKFPDGIRAVADYVHSLGLKFGIYASIGTTNCAGTTAGSYGHYQQDADTFASWGVDYVKVDWCAVPLQNYPTLTTTEVAQLLGAQMRDALAATGRPMVYDYNVSAGAVCANDCNDWTWGQGVANLWRIGPDGSDNYSAMVRNFTLDAPLDGFAGRGGWNDPDILEVGNGGMTTTEYRSQFSLWAEMAAPLLAGTDVSAMSADTLSILTNREVIAVDQDALGAQGHVVSDADGHWVLSRPLANGDRAVVLFNQTDTSAMISTSAADAGLAAAPDYTVRDLWAHSTTETPGPIAAGVPPHGVAMYRVSALPGAAGSYPPLTAVHVSVANSVLAGGGTTTVTSTLSDIGRVGLHDVSVSLDLPRGWLAEPAGPITSTDVPTGGSARATWHVSAPADAVFGPNQITSHARYVAGVRQEAAGSSDNLLIAYPSLTAAYNSVGITDPATRASADMGNPSARLSFDAAGLAAAGLTPGATVTQDGFTFTWPDVPAGQPDNVQAAGQAIALPADTTQVALLATSVNAASTVQADYVYADGSDQPVDLSIDYWRATQPTGDHQLVARVPTFRGDQQQGSGSMFYIPLPAPDAGPAALVLPSDVNVHIFALATR